MARLLNVKELKDLMALRERISNLEASNASLAKRNLELYKALELAELENNAQSQVIKSSGLTEYQPISFRLKHELMGARQPKYIKNEGEFA